MDTTRGRLARLAAQLMATPANHVQDIVGYGGLVRLKAMKPELAAASSSIRPKRVLITGAAGQIAYSLIHLVASGQTLGPQQRVILHLLDIEPMLPKLKGVVMEIEDCAYPLLAGIVATASEEEAFTGVDVAMLVGAMPRRPGMERKDLLQKNAEIFRSQGKALDRFASKDVKVVVVGNPANTNCLIALTNAPSIPKANFSALTRLDQNRARAQVALRTNLPITAVHDVHIWGNHSATQYPDLDHGTLSGADGKDNQKPIPSVITDVNWVRSTFIPTVQQRGAAVLAARQSSSAMSAAKAVSDHVHDWILGNPDNEIVSMAVYSDGSYGVPPGLIFSFPVRTGNGKYVIIQGLKFSDFAKEMIAKTTKELLEEKAMAGV